MSHTSLTHELTHAKLMMCVVSMAPCSVAVKTIIASSNRMRAYHLQCIRFLLVFFIIISFSESSGCIVFKNLIVGHDFLLLLLMLITY